MTELEGPPVDRDPGPVSLQLAFKLVVSVRVCRGCTDAVAGLIVNPELKVAVTEVSAFRVTVHVPVPEQPPPDQPTNVEPVSGVAVNLILLPRTNFAEHLLPQLIPAMLETTVPEPMVVTDSVTPGAFSIAMILPPRRIYSFDGVLGFCPNIL
jgi:hypothetical protein